MRDSGILFASMPVAWNYFIFLCILVTIEKVYFQCAKKYNIVDVPNSRSSHSEVTVRGGGIIFPIAILLLSTFSGFQFYLFSIGLFLISVISFYDDLFELSSKIRLLIHFWAVLFLFAEVGLFELPIFVILISIVFVIGTINAYNFMDGINGITGGYSLVIIGSIWFVNEQIHFVDVRWLAVSVLTLLIFNYYNFRVRAKCFAGDVGSVSMAFTVLFFISLLILHSQEIKYVGFLLLYGLDSISTIAFRIIRRENIFVAHRSHFYQYLANNLSWPHLAVSGSYMILQLLINVIIIVADMDMVLTTVFLLGIGMFFLGLRWVVEGRDVLLGKDYIKTNN